MNPCIVKKYKVNTDTTPDGFAEIFLLFSTKNPKGKNDMILFKPKQKWTNLKGTIANFGPVWACYPNFHLLSVCKLFQHMGLYVFNSVAPSPQDKNKFKPQQFNKVHGNSFIYTSCGPNVEHHHRNFKPFF